MGIPDRTTDKSGGNVVVEVVVGNVVEVVEVVVGNVVEVVDVVVGSGVDDVVG